MLPLVFAASALADDAPVNQPFVLGTVEVIGEREPDATALTTDVVDAAELQAKHRDDLAEALDLIPGVSVQNLGQRRERLISVRGFSSRQVPLYIDGVPVYVPYDGNVDLARFGVDYVSEIVVSKGLASLLYGPNILGGAVNVISRRPSQPLEASGRVASEWDDDFGAMEQRVTGSIGGLRGPWYAHLTASYVNADGYRLPDDFSPGYTPTYTTAEDGGKRERADSRDTVISAKVGYAPDAGNEFALSYYRQDGSKSDPPYAGGYLRSYACGTREAPKTCTHSDGVQPRFWEWPYWDKQSLYFVARNAVSAQGTLRWRLFYDTFRNALESYDDASFTTQTRPYAFHGSNYDDYTFGGNADFEWRWSSDNTTRIASHYRRDVHREEQTAPFSPEERLDIPTYDVALEHEWRLTPTLSLTPGWSHMEQPGRTAQVYDDNKKIFSPVHVDAADADNLQVVATYRYDEQQSFLAGISRKTRFPTLKERFSGGLGAVVPNPALEAEKALHFEVAYELRAEKWGGKIAYFISDLDDAIESVTLPSSACPSPPCSQNQNVGQQRNEGVEVSANVSPISTLQLSAQFNVLDRDNRSSPNVRPTNTPQYKSMLAGSWQFLPMWTLRADGQHESRRYSNTTGTRVAGEFTLANAFLRFAPVRQLGLEIGVRNITDELYAYEEGYYEAGRSWLAQVDYRY